MKKFTSQHHTDILGYNELFSCHLWLSSLAESLSSFLYIFIVCSIRISWTGAIIGHEPNLLAMSLSSGVAMMLLLITFRSVHVNPALTIAFLVTGRIPLIRAIIYVLIHCMSSISAIAFLHSISIKGHAGALGLDNPHSELSTGQILVIEAVISFLVTIITFAASNHSSYKCAKKFTLQQLGQTTSLFSPNSCDKTTLASFNSRRSVAPVVPHVPSTSITLLNTDNLLTNGQLTNNSPLNCALTMPANSRGLHLPHNSTTSNTHHNNNNKNNSNNNKNSLLATYCNETTPTMNHYEHEYEFDFGDNYRTTDYLNQPSSSEPSPQIPIEEVMEEECQLLSPNGFPMHLTKAHAFVIGLAYFLASLSGIPASGASINPARSFGPAFIMNHWDKHWIYWTGPILGAIIAGIFYEFIFSPTRKHSLCYRPKLFRLSALDMARVGLKSRLFHQQQQQQQQQQHQHHQQHLQSSQQPLYQQYQYQQQQQQQHLYQQPNSNSYQTHQQQQQNQSRHFHINSNSSQRPISTIYRPNNNGNSLYQSAADEFVHSANPTWHPSACLGNGYLNSDLPSSRLNVRTVDKFDLN